MSTVIQAIIKRLNAQQEKGIKKYKVAVAPINHTLIEWVEHDLEEQTDALVYKEAQKQTLHEISSLLQDALTATSMEECHNCIETALSRLGR
jgi:hypothetical protein